MIAWFAFLIAVTGAMLCAWMRREAFILLGTASVLWAYVGLSTGQAALASQQAIFACIAVYSYVQWRKDDQ